MIGLNLLCQVLYFPNVQQLAGMGGHVTNFWLMKSIGGLLEDKAFSKAFYFPLKRTELIEDKS